MKNVLKNIVPLFNPLYNIEQLLRVYNFDVLSVNFILHMKDNTLQILTYPKLLLSQRTDQPKRSYVMLTNRRNDERNEN